MDATFVTGSVWSTTLCRAQVVVRLRAAISSGAQFEDTTTDLSDLSLPASAAAPVGLLHKR